VRCHPKQVSRFGDSSGLGEQHSYSSQQTIQNRTSNDA
jgi:hypothetical protein